MIITVNRDDIDTAEQFNSNDCAIARAFRRHGVEAKVGVRHIKIENVGSIPMPPELVWFRREFDLGGDNGWRKTLKPITVELNETTNVLTFIASGS